MPSILPAALLMASLGPFGDAGPPPLRVGAALGEVHPQPERRTDPCPPASVI
jgi:hypothetical protein